jgi:hypothetical protein
MVRFDQTGWCVVRHEWSDDQLKWQTMDRNLAAIFRLIFIVVCGVLIIYPERLLNLFH